MRRLAVVLLAASAAAPSALPAAAGTQEACAQRVIRDWYAGGRVDRLYPLACYRAAIRALPADVLHYSDADRDIARALALARRGLRDPGKGSVPAGGARPVGEGDAAGAAPQSPATAPSPASRSTGASAGPTGEGPVQLASDEPAAAGAGLPYPVLLLGALACILLASGAVGWLAGRRR